MKWNIIQFRIRYLHDGVFQLKNRLIKNNLLNVLKFKDHFFPITDRKDNVTILLFIDIEFLIIIDHVASLCILIRIIQTARLRENSFSRRLINQYGNGCV